MRFASLLLTIGICLTLNSARVALAQGQTVRIANYNMLDKPTSGAQSADLRTIIDAIGEFEIDGHQESIDVFLFQEGPLSTSSYPFVENDFETVFGGDYEVRFASQDSSGDRTGVVYNASRLTLISWQSVNNMGFTHPPTLATFQPNDSSDLADRFSVISVHLKAGSSGSDFTRRTNEANSIGDVIDSLGTGANVVVAGDFNMQGSTENAWAAFVGGGLQDTLNAPFGLRIADWNEEVAYHPFHSQETTGGFGGMDDRFDFQLVTDSCLDDTGFEYIPGSVSVLGNNGTHTLNGGLMSGTGAAAIQNVLVGYSDHLPVFADFQYGVSQTTPPLMLNIETDANYTVQPGGPRTGSSGTSFVNIEGDGNGNFASFAVLDFDLAPVLTDEVADRLKNAGLTLEQANAGFSQDGPYSVYVAGAAATNVVIDSSIQYQSGNNGLDSLPASLRQGAMKLTTFPGVHRTTSGGLLPDGTVDVVGLYGEAIEMAILEAINSDGILRLLIVPDHDSTAATFSGNTNTSWMGPVLFGDFGIVTEAIVIATTFDVTQGVFAMGGLAELAQSDNMDLSVRRSNTDIQSRTELELSATSPSANPTSLSISYEGSVFARTAVNQTIELFNYDSGAWDQIDSRKATRFIDSVVIAPTGGDLSRFVEDGSLIIRARVSHQSDGNPRQQFTSNHDQFSWTIEY